MKTIGIGVDIVHNKRINKLIKNKNFINRTFAKSEIINSEKTFNKVPMTSWEYKYHLINHADKVMGFVNDNNNNNYGCSGYGYEVPQPLLKQDCHLDNCVINRTGNNNGIGLY